MEDMEPGEISRLPVQTRYGFHVLALDSRTEGQQLSFESVAEQIAIWLEARSWSRAVSLYITTLVNRADIQGIRIGGTEGVMVQ